MKYGMTGYTLKAEQTFFPGKEVVKELPMRRRILVELAKKPDDAADIHINDATRALAMEALALRIEVDDV